MTIEQELAAIDIRGMSDAGLIFSKAPLTLDCRPEWIEGRRETMAQDARLCLAIALRIMAQEARL